MTCQLRESLRDESVSELPLRKAILVNVDSPASGAEALLREGQLGCAVVVDAAGTAIGFFTERTLIEVLLAGKKLDQVRVGDHLDPDWFFVSCSDTVGAVCRKVVENGARFVCVLDAEQRPVGLTGQRGVAEFIAEHYHRDVMNQPVGAPSKMKQREGG